MVCSDYKLNQIKAGCQLSYEEFHNEDAKDILEIITRVEAAEKLLFLSPTSYDYKKALTAWQEASGKKEKPQ